ncbi:hypothetical protein M404DRAFT_1001307 [Pisolithus tinctorius Marx 270]|uniref:Uncharacterized protein n=1 Tax=Pisolithus tinctorius Marx 270 TaxID=870435 RepID=A0A0C3NRB6_PISTI|nr:hypothetical protein M404DRAFT_1001307 [Pisolithus tinctorius Marx 270]
MTILTSSDGMLCVPMKRPLSVVRPTDQSPSEPRPQVPIGFIKYYEKDKVRAPTGIA